MRQEAINKLTYSTNKALEVYTTSYLWPYERVLFSDYVRPGMIVLDVGCGVGRLTKYWWEHKVNFIGIDMVRQFIDRAREIYPSADFQVMNAASLEFADASFDLVFFSNQGIDYTERRLEVMREAHRALKPGGWWIFSSHNSLALPRTRKGWANLFENFSVWRWGYHLRVEHHQNGDLYVAYNNLWAETRLIEQAGFEVVEVLSNSQRWPRWPRFITAFTTRWPMYVCRKAF